MPDLSGPLQECLAAVKEKRNLQEILRRYPADRDELVGMLRLSVDLNAMGAPAADSAFRLRARNQMLAYAAKRRREHEGRTFSWLPQRVARVGMAAAAGLIPVAAGVTVAAASTNSLPGDPLYGVKLASERIELAATLNAAARARLELQFADARLTEAQRLYALGRTRDAVALVNQYDSAVLGLNSSLASTVLDDASIKDLNRYLDDGQQRADASLHALAGSFKAEGDSANAAMVAQAQAHADEAFSGSRSSLHSQEHGSQGEHQTRTTSGQR